MLFLLIYFSFTFFALYGRFSYFAKFKMFQSSFFLFPSALDIPSSNLWLSLVLDSPISKHQLICSSPLLPKRGRPFAFAIDISSLQNLLLKPTMSGTIQQESVSIITALPISKPKPYSIRQKKTSTCHSKCILIKKLDIKKAASVSFLLTFNDQLFQNTIGNFQTHVNRIAADTKDIYLSFGLFISSKTSQFIHQGDPIFILFSNSHAFTVLSLDQCRHVCGNLLFCKFCFQQTKKLKSPKFGATNIINVCAC